MFNDFYASAWVETCFNTEDMFRGSTNSGVYASRRCCYLCYSAQASPSGRNLWTLDMGLTRQTNTETPQPNALWTYSGFKSWFVRASRFISSADLLVSFPWQFPGLYTLLIGVFMIATQLIKPLTLVTLTPLIFTRPEQWCITVSPCGPEGSLLLFYFINVIFFMLMTEF